MISSIDLMQINIIPKHDYSRDKKKKKNDWLKFDLKLLKRTLHLSTLCIEVVKFNM